MNKKVSATTSDKKYFVLFQTDADGIRRYKAAPLETRTGTSISQMRVDGEMVPAIKLEVDKPTYDRFKRDQWMEEYHLRQEKRCITGGSDGKSRFCPCRIPNPDYQEGNSIPKTIANDCSKCPYYRSFRSARSKVLFSALGVTDDQGNETPFDPESADAISQADAYLELLSNLIDFIEIHYPKYQKYTQLIQILGHEYTLTEAADILDKPYRTLYGWIRTLRPIIDEYLDTTIRI